MASTPLIERSRLINPKPAVPDGPEPRAALATDRHAHDQGWHQREDVVVAKAVIVAEEVTGVGHVHLGAEDALERPADRAAPCQSAAVVESSAQ